MPSIRLLIRLLGSFTRPPKRFPLDGSSRGYRGDLALGGWNPSDHDGAFLAPWGESTCNWWIHPCDTMRKFHLKKISKYLNRLCLGSHHHHHHNTTIVSPQEPGSDSGGVWSCGLLYDPPGSAPHGLADWSCGGFLYSICEKSLA